MTVHHLGLAAEVQVNAGDSQARERVGIFREADRVSTQQLGANNRVMAVVRCP